MKAKLSDGFEVEIIEEALDDWEILETFYDIDNGDQGKIVGLARMVFGKDGVAALKDHLREKNGKASVVAMVEAITELMESANSLKNS